MLDCGQPPQKPGLEQKSSGRFEALADFREELGSEYDVDTHFTPNYNPWDQRLCAVPDGDMFAAIREGKAEVVTPYFPSSGTGQINAIFPVTKQDGKQIPEAQASSAKGFQTVSRL